MAKVIHYFRNQSRAMTELTLLLPSGSGRTVYINSDGVVYLGRQYGNPNAALPDNAFWHLDPIRLAQNAVMSCDRREKEAGVRRTLEALLADQPVDVIGQHKMRWAKGSCETLEIIQARSEDACQAAVSSTREVV